MIYVATFRRSGTHLCMETLNLNFGLNLNENNGNKTHKPYDKLLEQLKKEDKVIYVIRDGRDVMLSCFKWWLYSNEGIQSNITQTIKRCTFSQFLKGIKVNNFKPAMVQQYEYDQGMITDPIEFWRNHVLGYINTYDDRIYFIRYEELKDPMKISKMGEFFGKFKPPERIKIINKPVGYCVFPPREILDNTKKWKQSYSKEDLKFFNKKAGELLKELGYEVTE